MKKQVKAGHRIRKKTIAARRDAAGRNRNTARSPGGRMPGTAPLNPPRRPHPRSSRLHGLLFVCALAGLGLANIPGHERGEISIQENRPLAPFPVPGAESLASGAFAEGFDAWFSDRVVMRSEFLRLSRSIEGLHGVNSGPRLVQVRSGDLFADARDQASASAEGAVTNPGTGTTPDTPIAPPADGTGLPAPPSPDSGESSTPAPAHAAEGSEAGSPSLPAESDTAAAGAQADAAGNNNILILDNMGLEVIEYKQESVAYYASAVRRIADTAGPLVRSFYLVAPTHLAQVDPERYGGPIGADQKEALEFLHSQIGPTAMRVEVYPVLTDRSRDDIYFRTDHHWTARGAHLAYREFALAAGFEPVDLDSYSVRLVEGFLGSMHLLSGNTRLAREPDSLELFEPFTPHRYQVLSRGTMVDKPVLDYFYADRQNKYEIFMSSDRPLGVIRTETSNQRRLAVVKDSYGNAFVPFLIPHYREIHIIDPRYFQENLGGYLQEHEIDDLLVVNSLAVMSSARGFARNMHRILDIPAD